MSDCARPHTVECAGWWEQAYYSAHTKLDKRTVERDDAMRERTHLKAELSTLRASLERCREALEAADCQRDPACDEAYYTEGKCIVCETLEWLTDRIPPATAPAKPVYKDVNTGPSTGADKTVNEIDGANPCKVCESHPTFPNCPHCTKADPFSHPDAVEKRS